MFIPAGSPSGTKAVPRHPSTRSGFTLIEVIVAIVVLGSGLLSLAGTTVFVVRQVALADLITERSFALQSVVERVQATSFANVGSGADTVGNFALQWAAVDESSSSKIVTVVTKGPGLTTTAEGSFPFLGSNVVDSFAFRVISR